MDCVVLLTVEFLLPRVSSALYIVYLLNGYMFVMTFFFLKACSLPLASMVLSFSGLHPPALDVNSETLLVGVGQVSKKCPKCSSQVSSSTICW